MRVGFITSILWSRYGQFWTRLASDSGAEIVLAEPEKVLGQLSQKFLQQIPAAPFRLATAEALALADCDVIVTPHPNMGVESRRGAGQDPWASEFPEVLATSTGLRNLFGVPVKLDADVEPLAITFLQRLLHDGWRTRMIMERHQAQLKPGGRSLPPTVRREAVGVVGQPWLVDERLAALALPAVAATGFLAQSALDPQTLQEEGARTLSGLATSDLEVLGAVHWFSRRGDIGRLMMLVDAGNDHDRWLLAQAQKASHKPVASAEVQELLPGEELYLHLMGAAGRD